MLTKQENYTIELNLHFLMKVDLYHEISRAKKQMKRRKSSEILRIFVTKFAAIFLSVRISACNFTSEFQMQQVKCVLQKIFRLRPTYVSRVYFSDHFMSKMDDLSKK